MGESVHSKGPGRVFCCTAEGQAEVTEERPPPGGTTPEEMTFSTHLLSLNAAALLHMGLIPDLDPSSAEAQIDKDLDAAQHIIETLLVLREKTRGNLTPEEQKLLDTMLYDLRMRFVQAR